MSTTTPGGGDSSEADNSSSLNNTSSLVVEAGTTATGSGGGSGDTGQLMDEGDFDESSIEALNWSEADEEELQLQARKIKAKSPQVVQKVVDTTLEGELAAAAANLETLMDTSGQSDSLTTVRMLSSSLLQSIDDDTSEAGVKQAKNAVIQSWASEVKEAADRGEMIVEEQSEEEEGSTLEKGKQIGGSEGIRKRKKKVPIEDGMTASVLSSLTTESGFDPLSNAPVLDEGPIWSKGPKVYRFQDNRRINQKLTWCVLIAVVLAIGLGLGNLVAYNECETEYKQQQQVKSAEESVPTSSTPTPPEDTPSPAEPTQWKKELPDLPQDSKLPEPIHTKPDIETDREQYETQMEALTNIVKTLDHIQRKIDNFQNHTRRLGGVVMMSNNEKPESESVQQDEDTDEIVTTTPNPMDALWDDDPEDVESYQPDPNSVPDDINSFVEDQEAFVLDLIDGIEETVDYLRQQKELKYLKKLQKQMDSEPGSMFRARGTDQISPEAKNSGLLIQASVNVFQRSLDEFIRQERDELRDKKILGLAEDRLPEDYSSEEKAEIQAKYDKYMKDYPFKHEVDVEKERLKFLKDTDDPGYDPGLPEDDEDMSIEDFFLRRYNDFEDDENHQDLRKRIKDEEARIEEMFKEPMPEEETPSDASPDLTVTIHEDSDSKVVNPPDSSDKSSPSSGESDEITPNKRKKLKKNKSKKTRESEEEFGSGSGRKKKRSSSSHKKEKSSSNEGDDGHQKKKRNRQNTNKPPKSGSGSFKGYDLNNWSVDSSEADDDDDDHKRKKYHSNKSASEDVSPGSTKSKRGKTAEDSNWLLERTKVREAFRNMDSKLSRSQHSSGKKAHNWQIDRDSERRRVRSKKSEDDKKSSSY